MPQLETGYNAHGEITLLAFVCCCLSPCSLSFAADMAVLLDWTISLCSMIYVHMGGNDKTLYNLTLLKLSVAFILVLCVMWQGQPINKWQDFSP